MLRNNWVVSGIFLTGILRLNLKRREIWNFEQAVSKIFPVKLVPFFASTVFQSFRTELGFASIKPVLHTTMRHSIKYWSIFFSELIVSAEFIWQEIQGVENWKKTFSSSYSTFRIIHTIFLRFTLGRLMSIFSTAALQDSYLLSCTVGWISWGGKLGFINSWRGSGACPNESLWKSLKKICLARVHSNSSKVELDVFSLLTY